MSIRRILAVIRARNREFYRDKAGLGWNLLMPLLMILGFAFLFSGGEKELFKVGVLGERVPPESASPFLETRHIRFIPMTDAAAALAHALRRGDQFCFHPSVCVQKHLTPFLYYSPVR